MKGAAIVVDGDDPLAVLLRANSRAAELGDSDSDIPAVLALPMLHCGQLDGFILLGHKSSGESYRPDEIELLGWAAEQLGLDLHVLKVANLERDISVLEIRISELQNLLAVKTFPVTSQQPG